MKRKTILFLGLMVVLGGVFAAYKNFSRTSPSLYIYWAGFLPNFHNYRDVGQSVNECLSHEGGEKAVNEGAFGRASNRFSGWGCSSVGNPREILSLNFDPGTPTEFYCIDQDGEQNIGKHFNTVEIWRNDLFRNWADEGVRANVCPYFQAAYAALAADQPFLVHCEGGRDRTGAFVALVLASMLENHGVEPSKIIAAADCDYQKTASLTEKKRPKVRKLLHDVFAAYGTVTAFVIDRCGVSRELIAKAAENFRSS